MPLSNEQKSNVRRHLGYPVAGLVRTSTAGGSLGSGAVGYRFLQAYGFLEYKLNNLMPDEEARLLGLATAGVALLSQLQPNDGDTITVNLSGGNLSAPQVVSATLTASDRAADNRIVILGDLVNALLSTPAVLTAGMQAATPYGTGPYAQNTVGLPQIGITSPTSFTITAQGTGNVLPQITTAGSLLGPSTSLDGLVTTWGYLPILDGLEGAYLSASQNLDTIQADVWKGRGNELGQRRSLYETWRAAMSDMLGTQLFRGRSNAKRTGAVSYA